MNIEAEVRLTLMERIKAMGCVAHVSYQMITQDIDLRYPDLSDIDFDLVKKEAIKQRNAAYSAWIDLTVPRQAVS